MSEKSVIYFSDPGEENNEEKRSLFTEETLKAAMTRARELGIRDIVVASTRGEMGVKATDVFKDFNVVVVSHVTGQREPGVQPLAEESAKKIRANGGKIVTAAHTFSGVNRAIQTTFDTVYPAGIIAQTLRLLGDGMKVVVEITAMAADAGMIPVNKDVIAIAGSAKGADTAVVIKPANSHRLFEMFIREIITKPREPITRPQESVARPGNR